MSANDGSILTETKKALGIPEERVEFDPEITMFINATLGRLNQLGIGPEDGFAITDKNQVWSDMLGVNLNLAPCKAYMYLRVRMLFDPPDVGFVITAFKDEIDKLEWCINVVREDPLITIPVEVDEDVTVLDGGGP